MNTQQLMEEAFAQAQSDKLDSAAKDIIAEKFVMTNMHDHDHYYEGSAFNYESLTDKDIPILVAWAAERLCSEVAEEDSRDLASHAALWAAALPVAALDEEIECVRDMHAGMAASRDADGAALTVQERSQELLLGRLERLARKRKRSTGTGTGTASRVGNVDRFEVI